MWANSGLQWTMREDPRGSSKYKDGNLDNFCRMMKPKSKNLFIHLLCLIMLQLLSGLKWLISSWRQEFGIITTKVPSSLGPENFQAVWGLYDSPPQCRLALLCHLGFGEKRLSEFTGSVMSTKIHRCNPMFISVSNATHNCGLLKTVVKPDIQKFPQSSLLCEVLYYCKLKWEASLLPCRKWK